MIVNDEVLAAQVALINRYALIKGRLLPELEGQLTPIVEAIGHYNESGHGAIFDAHLINLASVYFENRTEIIALFNPQDELWTRIKQEARVEERSAKSPYASRQPAPKVCDSCDEDPVTYAEFRKQEAQKEKLALDRRLKELGILPGTNPAGERLMDHG